MSREITTSDGSFPSIAAAAKHYDLSPRLLARRIFKAGWTHEDACKVPPGSRNPKALSVDTKFDFPKGRMSITRAARLHMLDRRLLQNRLQVGWSPHDAATTPRHLKHPMPEDAQ